MQIDRELAATIMIVIAGCVGGWMLLVEPSLGELAKYESDIAEARSAMGASDVSSDEVMIAQISRLRARLIEMGEKSAVANDNAALYSTIMGLAKDANVEVKGVRPSAVPSSSQDRETRFHATRVDMTFQGGYENVIDFLQSVNDIDGFIRPVNVNLTPVGRGDEDQVSGHAVFEALSISIPDALLALQGGLDADS